MKKSLLAVLLLAGLQTGAWAEMRPMRILIVNDDGCASSGSTQLQDQLTAKGFDAWMVAPAVNQSGIGSAITFRPNRVFDLQKIGEKRYCFPGTPADSLDVAVLGLMQDNPPDLVISGVNDGPNTGASQLNSGTVNAAVRAVRYGYPAIAASIGYLANEEEMKNGWPATKKHWPDAVSYVVSLVEQLQHKWRPGHPLLPAHSGVSINYPPLDKENIKGVKYIANELHPLPQFRYELTDQGKIRQILRDEVLRPSLADNDTGWLNKGYITWSVFDGDINAPQKESEYRNLFAH